MQEKYVVVILTLWAVSCLLFTFFHLSRENEAARVSLIAIEATESEKSEANASASNFEQIVFNEDQYGPDIDLVIVIQVHNRITYLQELIQSLSESSGINRSLIIFSHDVQNEMIFENIKKIKFAKYTQIFYPFSLQKYPDKFPGPDSKDCQPSETPKADCPNINYTDTYGHFRNARVAQIKHHWWWKINFVFHKIRKLRNYLGLVLLLEEDHYVSPDFIYSLKMMENYSKQACPDCWFYALGAENYFYTPKSGHNVVIRNSLENLGLAFNRTIWRQIQRYYEDFCEFDDYNWDWTLRHIVNDIIKPKPASIIMADKKLVHIGSCGTHVKEGKCDPSHTIAEFKKKQENLFPKIIEVRRDAFAYSIKNNGGWGDPRDHALCINMTQIL